MNHNMMGILKSEKFIHEFVYLSTANSSPWVMCPFFQRTMNWVVLSHQFKRMDDKTEVLLEGVKQ